MRRGSFSSLARARERDEQNIDAQPLPRTAPVRELRRASIPAPPSTWKYENFLATMVSDSVDVPEQEEAWCRRRTLPHARSRRRLSSLIDDPPL